MPGEQKLERNGWAKTRLILQLAQGDRTQTELGAEYGVSQPTISVFASRHRDEIEARRVRIAEEYFGVWIAEKVNRIVECQADVDAINDAMGDTPDEKLLKVKLAILRQVSEELGQLKQNVELTAKITYAVEGVDLTGLQ